MNSEDGQVYSVRLFVYCNLSFSSCILFIKSGSWSCNLKGVIDPGVEAFKQAWGCGKCNYSILRQLKIKNQYKFEEYFVYYPDIPCLHVEWETGMLPYL